MENTYIVPADAAWDPIFSNDCWGYAIIPPPHDETVPYFLVACPKDKEDKDQETIQLCVYDSRTDALSGLDELLQAIDRGDRVFEF